MPTLQISDSRLELAVRAAHEAGNHAADMKHTTPSERKHNNSIVTEADRDAETIVRTILERNSKHPILGEEHGGDIETEDTYWVIDPIDGTRNFSYEQPLYGCAIALVEKNEPVVGVWYMPELQYLFYAVDGKGAYRGEQKLTVSSQEDISTAYPSISGKGRGDIYPRVVSNTEGAQQVGSAVMAECWVASGWCDVGVFGALAPWDMAVGVVILREAGGVMKSVANGNSDWHAIREGQVVMGNETLVDSVLDSFSQTDTNVVLGTEYDW